MAVPLCFTGEEKVDFTNPLCYNTLRCRKNAGIAQSVEQLIRNQQVVCSSHITSSMESR